MMVVRAGCLSTRSKQPSRLSLTSANNYATQGAKPVEMRARDRGSPRRDGANDRANQAPASPPFGGRNDGLADHVVNNDRWRCVRSSNATMPTQLVSVRGALLSNFERRTKTACAN